MKKVHVTRDGERMYIVEMEDSHLENTIKMILEQIIEAKKAARVNIELSDFDKAILGIKDKDIAKKGVGKMLLLVEMLPSYILESQIRGMDFSKELQNAFERAGRLCVGFYGGAKQIDFIEEEQLDSPF